MLGLEDLFPHPTHNPNAAPYFEIPKQKIVALEHPCLVHNVDNAVKSFGLNPNFHKLFSDDAHRASVPLWLRPGNHMSKPIISNSAQSNNVVLKITVPKRTGRKRKRGSDEMFSGDLVTSEAGSIHQVCSTGRQDDPKTLLRKIQDNVGKYEVEAVGHVKETHRYRGLADFQFSGTGLPYLTKVADHLLPMRGKQSDDSVKNHGQALTLVPLVSKLRELKIDPALYTGPGQEIIPPPNFTDRTIPFNYFYEQNPYVREQGTDEFGKPIVVNVQGRFTLTYGHYLEHDAYPAPTAPLKQVRSSHLVPQDLLDRMVAAMEERPIWTRRSFINRVRPYYSDNSMKIGIQMVGYQFKGGPWRDAVIKYGVDPRKDPQYRIYQTLAFKLNDFAPDSIVRNGFVRRMGKEESRRSHLWDGESYCTNGKFWQICDITDPTLVKLIKEAPLRDECDIVADGWWNNGSWSKFKSFMRAKMIAIKVGRLGSDNDDQKRKGYIYNSDLTRKLNQLPNVFPATYRNPVAVTTLLEGMEGVDGLEKIRYKYRPRDSYRDPLVAMGFGSEVRRKPKRRSNVTSQPNGQGRESNARDSEDESGHGQNESGGEGGPRYPDDAWAHILDSDLDSDVSGEGGDEDGDEDGDDVNETTIADVRDNGDAGEDGEVDDNEDIDDECEDEADDADEEDGEPVDEDELEDENEAVDQDMDDDEGFGDDDSEGGFISDY